MLDEPLVHTYAAGKKDGTTILKLVGPLTLSTMFGFQNEFRSQTPQVMIVDLSESPYMDSAGLGLLMNYYVSAEHNGRKILLAGANHRIVAMLEMTKVNSVLRTSPLLRKLRQSCKLPRKETTDSSSLGCAQCAE